MSDYDQIIRQARYISPSGASIVMQFDDVERSSGKKIAVHELPQQNIPIVQDQGNQARRYPFACYFSGENAYTQADALDAALSEIGPGTFEHPMFGNLDVLASTWAESRKLVDGLGRVDFSIEFVQAPKIKPLSASTPLSKAETVIDKTNTAINTSISDAAQSFSPSNAADKVASKNRVLAAVKSFGDAFRDVTSKVSDVSTSISRQARTITNTIDDLIEAPLELFNALATLSRTPATIVASISSKLDAYREQALAITAAVPASYAQAIASVESLFYALGGACEASTVGDLSSRSNAIAASDAMGTIIETVLTYIEAAEVAIPGYHPNPDILVEFIDAASKARSSLLERAFSLRSERRITLDVETTPFNLIAQFYGDTADSVPDLDAALDNFISINHLIGCETCLVPAGREVVYYV